MQGNPLLLNYIHILIYFYRHNILNTMTKETFVVKTGENSICRSTQKKHTPDRWIMMLSIYIANHFITSYVFVDRIIFDHTFLCLQQGNALNIRLLRRFGCQACKRNERQSLSTQKTAFERLNLKYAVIRSTNHLLGNIIITQQPNNSSRRFIVIVIVFFPSYQQSRLRPPPSSPPSPPSP